MLISKFPGDWIHQVHVPVTVRLRGTITLLFIFCFPPPPLISSSCHLSCFSAGFLFFLFCLQATLSLYGNLCFLSSLQYLVVCLYAALCCQLSGLYRLLRALNIVNILCLSVELFWTSHWCVESSGLRITDSFDSMLIIFIMKKSVCMEMIFNRLTPEDDENQNVLSFSLCCQQPRSDWTLGYQTWCQLNFQLQGKQRVLTRKGKKTWVTFSVARQWQARSPSLCSQLHILPINWALGTKFTRHFADFGV